LGDEKKVRGFPDVKKEKFGVGGFHKLGGGRGG